MANSKCTEEVIDKLEEAIRLGAVYEHACNYAGISYQTFRNWILQGEQAKSGQKKEFVKRIRKAEGDATKKWLGMIEAAARDGNWPAAAWKLERRYPSDYGKHIKQKVESQNINIDLSELTDEQLKRLAAGESIVDVLAD
jgi:hypothetical protein